MKKVFSAVLLSAGLLIGFSSCKKDKDNSSNPENPVTKIQEFKNGEDFIRFEYNTDGTVKKATLKSDLNTDGDIIDYVIAYNPNKKIASLTTTTGKKIEPVYENNVMTRADVYQDNDRIAYTNYTYTNNQLTRATIYLALGDDYEPFLEFNFTYNAGGNISETLAMISNGIPGQLVRSGHVTSEFDQKTNPLYEHRDLLALFWQGASKNNIMLENHFDADQVLEDKYSYAYTYKSNGLPQHAVVKIGLPGQPETTSNIDFIYR